MNAEMKARIDSHLKTDAKVVALSQEVRATGGAAAVCQRYDVAERAENESYRLNIDEPGLTRESWKYYDAQRAKIYQGI